MKVLSPKLQRLEFINCSDELVEYFEKLVDSSSDFGNLKFINK